MYDGIINQNKCIYSYILIMKHVSVTIQCYGEECRVNTLLAVILGDFIGAAFTAVQVTAPNKFTTF